MAEPRARLSVGFPLDLYNGLKVRATETGDPMATLIRSAVRQYLEAGVAVESRLSGSGP